MLRSTQYAREVMALPDKRAALMAYILLSFLALTVPQNVNASNIEIRVEAVGGGLPPNTVYAGDVFNIYFRVNVAYTGTISGTLGYSKCQGCASIWQTNYPGIASGVEEATSIGFDQVIYTVGGYVIFLYVTIPGPMGGAAMAGYADFQVIPQSTVTTAAGSGTDWTVISVGLSPPNPQVGDPVTFSMVVTAFSSPTSFPQNFAAVCMIDGASCGSGSFTYPGPLGAPFTVSAQTPWIAAVGTHTLAWGVATIPVGLDPNKGNNMKSITFTVAQALPQQMTTTSSTYSSTSQARSDFQVNVAPPSQTVLQGETVSYSVNVVGLNGFNSQVSLSVSGLPSGANGAFSNPSGTPNFASTLTVTLPADVSTGSYTLTVTGNSGGVSHVANLVLTINAATVTQTSISSSSTQTSNDLMNMLQQNQFLILGGVLLIAVLAVAVLMSRRKPMQTQPTSSAAPGMIYCRKCGTQNPTTSEFCGKCGTKLQ